MLPNLGDCPKVHEEGAKVIVRDVIVESIRAFLAPVLLTGRWPNEHPARRMVFKIWSSKYFLQTCSLQVHGLERFFWFLQCFHWQHLHPPQPFSSQPAKMCKKCFQILVQNINLYLLSINPMGSRVEAIFKGGHRGECGKPEEKYQSPLKKGSKVATHPKPRLLPSGKRLTRTSSIGHLKKRKIDSLAQKPWIFKSTLLRGRLGGFDQWSHSWALQWRVFCLQLGLSGVELDGPFWCSSTYTLTPYFWYFSLYTELVPASILTCSTKYVRYQVGI